MNDTIFQEILKSKDIYEKNTGSMPENVLITQKGYENLKSYLFAQGKSDWLVNGRFLGMKLIVAPS